MHGPTLPFAPTKTYDPISIDLRDKQRKKNKNLSLCFHAPSLLKNPFPFLTFILFIIIIVFIWIYDSYCLIRVRFCPKTIYLFSVHFILNELSLNHFPTFEIFIKISSLKSLATYHLENRKNILTVSEFDETFLGH